MGGGRAKSRGKFEPMFINVLYMLPLRLISPTLTQAHAARSFTCDYTLRVPQLEESRSSSQETLSGSSASRLCSERLHTLWEVLRCI